MTKRESIATRVAAALDPLDHQEQVGRAHKSLQDAADVLGHQHTESGESSGGNIDHLSDYLDTSLPHLMGVQDHAARDQLFKQYQLLKKHERSGERPDQPGPYTISRPKPQPGV